jgi:predicted 3-demethylubiquinone-9 3-methyltransferase (glyoxalase superfamily)
MATLQKIVPNLWFDGNAKEAIDFYTEVFNDSKITSTSYYPTEGLADFQQSLAGKELSISFELLGMQFVAINAGPEFKFNESISFAVSCENQDEIDYYWEKLSAVPEAEQCGWLKDKYGLSWQIVPANMDELMTGSDGSQNPKAFQAMMQMKKLDMNEFERLKNE